MTHSIDLDQIRNLLGDRYTIERELGRGGMGAVYLARDIRLDRLVALKVLPAEFAAQSALRERFLRETRTAASFSHPNIVPVYAVEEAETLIAFAMGFVEGESLGERVQRGGPLTVRETVKMLQDVAYALAYAHGRGVVHRDIKPDNIMIERATGRALVMDFGISRTMAAPVANTGLTRVGEVVGTPEYMSPEQASGDTVDGRSDLYSLGLTAYFCATGTQAISGDTTQKVLVKQLTETVPPVASVRADLPIQLSQAIDRCVAKDPANRFQSAESLVEALDLAQLAAPEVPVPVRMFAQEANTLGLVLVGSAVLAFVLVRGEREGTLLDDLDAMLPLMLILAVSATRALQTRSEARRLAQAGFAAKDVVRGLGIVVDEREIRRAELRADARTMRARRITMVMAVLQIAMAIVLFRGALSFRTEYAPGKFTTSTPGAIMLLSSASLFGVGLVLLVKSPLRMPLGERLFRWIWLGPLGRLFLRSAAAGAKRARTPEPSKAPPSPRKNNAANLESRVAALEAWRADVAKRPAARERDVQAPDR